MKYFKDEKNNVYAYAADGSEDDFIKPELISISETEALAIVNPPPTHEELLAAVEIHRAELLSAADRVTSDWRTELMLGEINEADKASLSSWMEYKRNVKAVNAEDAVRPDFNWPALPSQ
ncbi:tail fiber assembly protein [Salmonella enterica]|nr:tail fiber assembly protein [Salmonella enterica]EEH5261849.1 tail fiber assembly protein [Salmonella enterica]